MDGSTQITILTIATLGFSFLCSAIISYAYSQRTVRIINGIGVVLVIGGFLLVPLLRIWLTDAADPVLNASANLLFVLGVALLCGLLLSLRFFRFQARQQAKRSATAEHRVG